MPRIAAVAFVVLLLHALLPASGARTQPKPGFRAEMIEQIDDVAKKLISMAEAMPEEKFPWRPAEGVRSVSEVYMHVVGGNYFFGTFLGVKIPAGIERSMEKDVTAKPQVLEQLRTSIEHVRTILLQMSDKDLEKPVKMFGRTTSTRNAAVTMLAHMHEHLGQAIAYGRMNGVVPPWSPTEK